MQNTDRILNYRKKKPRMPEEEIERSVKVECNKHSQYLVKKDYAEVWNLNYGTILLSLCDS